MDQEARAAIAPERLEVRMLRVYSSKGGDAAKAYFFSGLMHGDYYAEGQERVGQWWGKGAELLNLRGPVLTRDFCRLVDNQHPATGERLTLRNDRDRRAGYDLTFCPCKSLSVIALLNGDERLIDAVYQSVLFSLEEAQKLVQTRVRKGGSTQSRYTGNLISALFAHLTARPDEGQLPDPFVHVHAFTVNATFDPAEHVWKAIELLQIKSNAPYLEAVFHNELARRVKELGYSVVTKGKFWEIDGVPQSVIDRFSKRGQRVEEVARERGIDDPAEKSGLAARTRRGKAPEHTLAELRKGWWEQLSAAEARKLRGVKPDTKRARQPTPESVAKEAVRTVRSVSASLFERTSTVTEARLVEACLRKCPGTLLKGDVQEAATQVGLKLRVHQGTRRFVHPAVLREEQQIVEVVKAGKGVCKAAAPEHPIPEGLTKDQARAMRHILSSRDRFIVIEGAPGTGKTRLTRDSSKAINGSLRRWLSPVLGDKIAFVAPTTQASRVVLREEGFKNAETVARFLKSPTLQNQARGGWIWIDEGGLLGTRDANAMVKLASHLKARVIVTGDRGQNQPVPRGNFLDLLVEHAGVETPRMQEIVRQKGRLKDIVSTIDQGNVEQGLAALHHDGNLHELPYGLCQQRAAEEYVKRRRSGQNVAIVTPTHHEGEHVTACVRNELHAAGLLGKSRKVKRWEQLDLTAEERRDPKVYKIGQMVQINRKTPGMTFGKQYEVVNTNWLSVGPYKDHVIVRAPGEVAEALSLRYADRWSVYAPKEIDIARNDVIRITRNTKTHTLRSQFVSSVVDQFELSDRRRVYPKVELANGTVHRVREFAINGDIILEGGKILRHDCGHFTHGYYRTGHSAQSITADAAIVVATKEELAPLDHGNFNVAASRGRSHLSVYTDDKEELIAAASRVRRDPNSMDVERDGVDPAAQQRRAASDRSRTQEYMRWRDKQAEKNNGRDH